MTDVAITPGEHICALYLSDDERDDILLPYLRTGLEAGDKCLFAVHENSPQRILDNIGIDVSALVETRQLEVRTSADPLLTPDDFSGDAIIEFWDSTARAALDAGFPFVRLGAEMSWWMPQMPGLVEMFQYESELNRFTGRYPQAILCMYDLREYRENIMLDLLKTHPRVLICGVLLENPYYLTPDEYVALSLSS
jgi:hypothetical protein